VSKHERFEELCAAASIGQASAAELAELQEHLPGCADCQQAYSEFLQINADNYARRAPEQELASDEAVGYIDSALFRERFLKRAEAQGIISSNGNAAAHLPDPQIQMSKIRQWPVLLTHAAAAAALLAAVGLSAYYVGVQEARRSLLANDRNETQHASTGASKPKQTSDRDRTSVLAGLEASNGSLIAEVASLKKSLDTQSSRVADLRSNNSATERERSYLTSTVKERDSTIADLQQRLDQAQVTVTSVRAELDKTQANAAGNQAQLIEDRIKLRDLSDQLAEASTALTRERELLTAGRDIRELMSARNLHIVDVGDVDPKGKERPAFGRIFFTEGKSLLFYAYDLSDSRVQDAGYHYRIWGKKEGPNQRAKNLGMFYSDDKSQKRWVFQYDDPKVLNEIDSVFVTVESPTENSRQPKGDKLMYAYLRGQANHP
jgi:hypothetical protein